VEGCLLRAGILLVREERTGASELLRCGRGAEDQCGEGGHEEERA